MPEELKAKGLSSGASAISEGGIFIYSCSAQLISFEVGSISKEINCAEHEYMNMSPSLIALAPLLKGLTSKSTIFSLKREYYVDIKNCPQEELDKAIEKFYVEVCNFVTPIFKQIIKRCCFVQFWINSARDVWKFCHIGLASAARPILAKLPNNTRTINPKLFSQSHD